MNEISFGNAMVAVENGKDVQLCWHDCWHDYNKDSSGYNHKNLHLLKWRIKEEHTKLGQALMENKESKRRFIHDYLFKSKEDACKWCEDHNCILIKFPAYHWIEL